MDSPTLTQLDEDRKNGFRPTVICCVINENKLLLFFNKEYSLWMLPQGGIMNGEEPESSLLREINDELGMEFSSDCDKTYIYLGEEIVEFISGKHNIVELRTDEGESVEPKGKKYYYYAVYKRTPDFAPEKTKFSESFWSNYKAGSFLAEKIPQRGKRRITLKAFELLKNSKLIS